ncbi:Zinc finger protein [Pseudolycoriella hygida]|uniref:Zinc finger protein n=1 Tax=Pseudolycoriella hygida TaxID=35572 RepID=A0A9Q0MWH4_9DIPT|nr:Zinc finger protein [Pseudolycoriella hygida]KAJ6637902.1 Zinc finger protein [Pseudolycoriella hygida]
MEVVNVKNVIIKYIPEHIVVETHILPNHSQTAEASQHSKATIKVNHESDRDEEPLDDLYYISMDESLDPDSDDNDFDGSVKEFLEEEYLDIEDDVHEMFIESDDETGNFEIVEIEPQAANEVRQSKKDSVQLLKDWFFDHLSNPYPTEKEKEMLATSTNKSLVQINNWFTNMRKRNKDKITFIKSEKMDIEDDVASKIKLESDTISPACDSSQDIQIQLAVKLPKSKRSTKSQTPAICDICGKTFSHRRMLQSHLKRHDPSKWEKCEICSKSFPDGLKRHMRTHSGERPFTCDQCGASYTQSFALKIHKASHDNSGDEYYCDICSNGKAFYNRFKFKYHVRSHFLEKTLRTCEICGFKTNNLKSHIITRHSTLRPFKCEVCGETFKFKAVYRTHLLIHSESTPYACDKCDKTFKAEYSLARHRVVHSEEKNFICTICSKAFLLQRYLSKHMRGHAGTRKRHACTECSKDYSNVTDRRRHMEREHGIIEVPNPKYANNKMKKKTVVPCNDE